MKFFLGFMLDSRFCCVIQSELLVYKHSVKFTSNNPLITSYDSRNIINSQFPILEILWLGFIVPHLCTFRSIHKKRIVEMISLTVDLVSSYFSLQRSFSTIYCDGRTFVSFLYSLGRFLYTVLSPCQISEIQNIFRK